MWHVPIYANSITFFTEIVPADLGITKAKVTQQTPNNGIFGIILRQMLLI